MAEKKKPKLEMLLDDFRAHGGDESSLVQKGRDAKFYEGHILPRAREWLSPEIKGHIARASRSIRDDIKKSFKDHLDGAYKKGLMSKLKEGEELPEGHNQSFTHLGPEKSVDEARKLLNEMIFHGMGYKWGLSTKEVREKYAKGDDQIRDQFKTFIASYIGKSRDKEGNELSPDDILNSLAGQLAKSDDVFSDFDAPDNELNKFLSTYTNKLNRFTSVANAYTSASLGLSRTHKGAVKKATNAVAGKYGYQLKGDLETQEMMTVYLTSHGKDFPIGEAHKNYVEPLPKKK